MRILKKVVVLALALSLLASFPVNPTAFATSANTDVQLYDLTTSDQTDPIGLDDPDPHFGWKMRSDVLGQKQTAYQIVVKNGSTTMWDSGKVSSDISVGIVYKGLPLSSSTRYTWTVTVWDKDGSAVTSEPAFFEMALLEEDAFENTYFISYQSGGITDYTIDLDFAVTKGAVGPVFGASGSSDYVLWQVNAGQMKLRPHFRKGNSWAAYPGMTNSQYPVSAMDLTGAFSGLNQPHHMRIEVRGTTIKTYIGASADAMTLVGTYTHPTTIPLGQVGVRQGGNEWGWFDNFIVTDPNGNVLYKNTFDEEAPNDLSITGGSVTEGKLVMNPTAEVLCLQPGDGNSLPAYRKSVEVKEGLVSAKLYTAGLGVYESFINGQRVGNKLPDGTVRYDELKPGFTQRNKRQFYSSYDVTWMLNPGQENVLGGVVTDGWWKGVGALHLGKETAYLAKLILTYSDGTQEIISTDTTWKTAKKAAFQAGTGIYAGERYDASVDQGWMKPGYDDSTWGNAKRNTEFKGTLDAWQGVPIIVREDLERKPQSMKIYEGATGASSTAYGDVVQISTHSDGQSISLSAGQTLLVNFGQNFAGWEYLELEGPRGTVVTVEHGEWLNEAGGVISRGNDGPGGSIYNANYRQATANTIYTMSGNGVESYHPSHSFYGFQYIEITATADITIHKIRGQVVTSVQKDTSSMVTNDENINQLLSNVRWGMYSNYLSVPTDCPQRNERHGWGGDTQVFSQAGTYLTDAKSFLSKYLQDMRDGQADAVIYGGNFNGAYPDIAPYVNNYGYSPNDPNDPYGNKTYGEVGWGDAAIIVPWTLYMMYGDPSVIEVHWDSMRLYMDTFLASSNGDGFGYGAKDHLSPEVSTAAMGKFLAVCFYAWDALMMADMANAIGDTEAAAHYMEVYEQEKKIFQERFVKEDGSLTRFEQTAALYALFLDLLPNEQSEQVVADHLASSIQQYGDKMMTGFLGTSIINTTLTKIGRSDLAYTLLLQREYPSWLYSVDQGATTIWERWNTYTVATGFGDVTMNSFNHYSYGAVAGWMYQTVAGIGYDTENPGFKNILLAPAFDARLPQVQSSYESAYGLIKTSTDVQKDGWTYTATIPANTTATVKLPVGNGTLKVGGKALDKLTLESDGIVYTGTEDGIVLLNAVAGSFTFTYTEASADSSDAPTTQLDWSKPQYCQHCKKEVTWTACSKASDISAGHCYLTCDITASADIVISGKVCLHLNGHSITATGDRVFDVAAGASLAIVDHPENLGELIRSGSSTASGGILRISGSGQTQVYGGTLMLSEGSTGGCGALVYTSDTASFTLNGGLLQNGAVASSASDKNGGSIYAAGSSKITLNGGTVHGGKAPGNGGNIYVCDTATLSIHGGTVSGGKSDSMGGNIHMNTGTTLTIDEDAAAAVITLGNAVQGGNINLEGATATVDAGQILYGYATATAYATGGGNIRVSKTGKLTINQDTGKQTLISNGKSASKYYGGNIFCVGTVIMNDGTVRRGYNASGGSNLAVQGNFTMNGGFLGEATSNANVLILSGSKMRINGGTVSGNTQGGEMPRNIQIWDSGSLEVTGGTLINEGCTAIGGNIYADKAGSVTITGGTITGCADSDIGINMVAEVAGATNNAAKGAKLALSNATVGSVYLSDANSTHNPSVTFSGTLKVEKVVRNDVSIAFALTEGADVCISGEEEGTVFGAGTSATGIRSDGDLVATVQDGNFVWKLPNSYTLTITGDTANAVGLVSINGGEKQKLPLTLTVYEGKTLQIQGFAGNDVDYAVTGWTVDGTAVAEEILSYTVTGDMNITLHSKFTGLESLATGKTAISSDTVSGTTEWMPAMLLDGITQSDAKPRGYSTKYYASNALNSWFGVDLEQNTWIDRIHIYPRTDKLTADGTTTSFPVTFSVQVCKDGQTEYSTIATFTDQAAPYMKPAVITFDPVQARQVRILVTKVSGQNAGESGYYAQVAELGVYNTSKPVVIGQQGYDSLSQALADLQPGQTVKLMGNITEDVVINKDVWLDLNGCILTGNLSGTGTLYGMDSSSNSYTEPSGRIEGSITCQLPGNVKAADAKRYLAVSDSTGYTFHRFYMGITHMNLQPATTGVGYKAMFYGNETVKAQLNKQDSHGFILWVGEDGPKHSFGKTWVDYATGSPMTLRLDNFDVENYGETKIYGQVYIKLADGTVIESTVYSYTLRQLVEYVSNHLGSYSDAQLTALQEMVNTYSDAMADWDIDAIRNYNS